MLYLAFRINFNIKDELPLKIGYGSGQNNRITKYAVFLQNKYAFLYKPATESVKVPKKKMKKKNNKIYGCLNFSRNILISYMFSVYEMFSNLVASHL